VATIHKHLGDSALGRSTIESWFTTSDEKSDPRIYPGLGPKETAEVKDRLWAWLNEKFRILSDITINQRPHLQAFYSVSEQIACWFDQKSRLGYEGGISMSKRPRTEDTLSDLFGTSGCAAILLYVMGHYMQMNDLGSGFDVEDAEYVQRFQEQVWFCLAHTLMLRWNVCPLESQWYKAVRKLDKNPERLKVDPMVLISDIIESQE
jgi:hypothetical protein